VVSEQESGHKIYKVGDIYVGVPVSNDVLDTRSAETGGMPGVKSAFSIDDLREKIKK
jgi:hypothetical protein